MGNTIESSGLTVIAFKNSGITVILSKKAVVYAVTRGLHH